MSYGTTMGGINLDSSSSSYYKSAPSAKLQEDVTRLNVQPDTAPKGEVQKYNVTDFAYPEGISSDLDKQHYIQFYINVRGKSKFNEGEAKGREQIKNNLMADVVVGSGENRIDPNRSAQRVNDLTSFVKGNGGSKLGEILGIGDGKQVKQTTPSSESSDYSTNAGSPGIIDAAKNTVQKGVNTALEGLATLKPDVPRRLRDVITLHIQDRPAVNYGVSYQETSLGMAGGGLLGGGQGTSDSIGMNQESVKEATAAMATQVVGGLSSILGALGGTRPGDILVNASKQITNPFREQFFERVDFRTFNFRHTFMPKSAEEAQKVRDIIKMFKFHMHPELVGGLGLMFLYPSEFEIKYMYRGEENTYFNKISTCVLEDMNVEYGGDIFASFEDGQPVEVNMSLRFKELEVLTKERIAEGF